MKEFLKLFVGVMTVFIAGGIVGYISAPKAILEEDEISLMWDNKPDEFKTNYKIDLKPDGYLILDEQDELYFVPFDGLEDWFLEMNL